MVLQETVSVVVFIQICFWNTTILLSLVLVYIIKMVTPSYDLPPRRIGGNWIFTSNPLYQSVDDPPSTSIVSAAQDPIA